MKTYRFSSRSSTARSPVASQTRQSHPKMLSIESSNQRLLQKKSDIDSDGDLLEREADQVAGQVMRMPDPAVQRKSNCSCGATCPTCTANSNTHLGLMRKEANTGSASFAAPSTVSDAVRSPGQPLDAATRAFMEPRFGHDFSRVRIHNDGKAAESARSVDALAYTVGDHVVFAKGQYSPNSQSGQRLLAHELTHVVQQRKAGKRIQRARNHELENDPTTAPAMSCPVATTSPSGVSLDITFGRGSYALSPDEITGIDNFVHNWHSTAVAEPVRIDGYASIDGSPATNWPLSCQRAEAVAHALMHPSDGSPGIPADNIELFANGETEQFSTGLAPNRRATVHIPSSPSAPPTPTPTPTPSQLNVVPCRSLPKQIFNRGGCGSGSDFTHHDFPSLSGVGRAGRALVWQADNLSTDFRLRNDMRTELGVLGGSEGFRMVSHFAGGTGSKLTHDSTSPLGGDALSSPTFRSLNTAVASEIDTRLRSMAGSGTVDCNALNLTGATLPAVSFGFSDTWRLKGIIGGTQGLRIRMTRFRVDPATRRYSIGLQYLICDDFGVDTSDLYSPGLAAFWVLQHRRSGNLPFINELDLSKTASGTL